MWWAVPHGARKFEQSTEKLTKHFWSDYTTITTRRGPIVGPDKIGIPDIGSEISFSDCPQSVGPDPIFGNAP